MTASGDRAGPLDQPSVRRWLDAHARQWGAGGADPDGTARGAVLLRFCERVGNTPDELVASLFRPTPEGPRIRLKRRREVMAQIDEFEAEAGDRNAGNVVRSFLIHNGVALSARPLV